MFEISYLPTSQSGKEADLEILSTQFLSSYDGAMCSPVTKLTKLKKVEQH